MITLYALLLIQKINTLLCECHRATLCYWQTHKCSRKQHDIQWMQKFFHVDWAVAATSSTTLVSFIATNFGIVRKSTRSKLMH